VTNSFEAIH